MHFVTQFLLSFSALTTAGAMVFMALEMKHVRGAIENKRRTASPLDAFGTSSRFSSRRSDHSNAGFGIYVYREGSWHLEADLSAPGYEVTAPTIKGSFNGQVVKRDATVRN